MLKSAQYDLPLDTPISSSSESLVEGLPEKIQCSLEFTRLDALSKAVVDEALSKAPPQLGTLPEVIVKFFAHVTETAFYKNPMQVMLDVEWCYRNGLEMMRKA